MRFASNPKRRLAIQAVLVFFGAMAAIVPTLGDFGLTWDEPAYRYSQLVSAQWWERLGSARSGPDLAALVEADALLYYWPYGRHGINFHPPLAGQVSVLTEALFGLWMQDIPARRLASALEFAGAIMLLFVVLARRDGAWVGLTAAGALLTIPRVYAHGHIAGTDTPGLLLWPLTAVAVWYGLQDGHRKWRWAFGVLVGLGFLTKMAAVVVLVPVAIWMAATRLIPFLRKGTRADWLDGFLTLGLLLLPLALAFSEVLRLSRMLPEPKVTDLFRDRSPAQFSGLILLAPLAVWFVRRGLGWIWPRSGLWGAERPSLELMASVLAFAPFVGWLGNPAWWRESLPRLAHYYLLNTNREGSLPDIRIYYWGETYLYSLPWHNAWVLIAITVPVSLLLPASLSLIRSLLPGLQDHLPRYFLLHFLTLPAIRMLNTPAHDGIRLFLPAFFFLAAFSAWGALLLSEWLVRLTRVNQRAWIRSFVGIVIVGPAAGALAWVHPFELSYYNAIVGGPSGAWRRGFELSYWYDAYTPKTLEDLNERLPDGAHLTAPNEYSQVPTFGELQTLGSLRSDLRINDEPPDDFAYKWLLTHDSKATAFTRLLFVLEPWYQNSPRQTDGTRVTMVADPTAVSRAWALLLLADLPESRRPRPADPQAPGWVRAYVPFLARFWGVGLARPKPSAVNPESFAWAESDPQGFVRAARVIVSAPTIEEAAKDTGARRLLAIIDDSYGLDDLAFLLARRPEALLEAATILAHRPDSIRKVLLRSGYTDPASIGGSIDRDLQTYVELPTLN